MMEYREKWGPLQLLNPRLFFHAFLILKVEGGFAICTEKYNDKLEVMFGETQVLAHYALHTRATGDRRLRYGCAQQDPRNTQGHVTVGDFLEWLSGDLAITWKPYCLFSANCQHYAADAQRVLEKPGLVQSVKKDPVVILEALKHDPCKIALADSDLRSDPRFVNQALSVNPLVLAHIDLDLKQKSDFVAVFFRGRPDLAKNHRFIQEVLEVSPGLLFHAEDTFIIEAAKYVNRLVPKEGREEASIRREMQRRIAIVLDCYLEGSRAANNQQCCWQLLELHDWDC